MPICSPCLQVFEKIPGLLYFYVQRNQLNEVPSGLPTSLEQLRLDRNRISKIPAGAFTKLQNLTLLDLHYNQVNHISHLCRQESQLHYGK